MEDIVEFASQFVKGQVPQISTLTVAYMIRVVTPKPNATHLQTEYFGRFISSILDLVSYSSNLEGIVSVREAAAPCWTGLVPSLGTASIDIFAEIAILWQRDLVDANHIGRFVRPSACASS